MKTLILILTLFVLTISVKAQFAKPTGSVTIPTYSFLRTPLDSGVHIYQGSTNLYNSFWMKFDTVKIKGLATQFDLLRYKLKDDSSKLYKLKTDSILNSGYASIYKNSLKQNQLSGTGYVYFTGTTPSYLNETYKLRADSILNAGFYTNYKASIASYLANDTWTKVYDYAGNLQNMWKVSKDNILTPGFRLGIDQLYTAADAGKVTIAQMPNLRSASGDTLQYSIKIGNVEMLKMRGIANGSGGLSDTTIVIPKLRLSRNAVNGYYLKVVDAYGTIKPRPIEATYQGTWNATTNTPTLADGTGTASFWYRCVVAGTVDFGAGNITFSVGDDAYYSGTVWQRIPAVSYTLQAATKTVFGGVKLDSTTIKYNGSGQLYVTKTDYVENATHTGDATGATALTLATVNSNVGTYQGMAVNAKGLVTAASNLNYRPMADHDSLSTLQEKNYSSLDGKPDLTVYQLDNDSVANSGYYTNYKASVGTGFTLQNDQWLQAKDYAGNIFNLIKVSKDNMVTVPNLAVKSFWFVRNAGINNLGWIPLNADGEGLEQGYELWAGNTRLMKLYGLGTAGGDIDSARAVFSNVFISQGAALNKIAMSEDSRGKVRWSDTKYLFNLVANRILYASATNEMGQLPLGTLNNIMLSGGTGTPTWSNYTLPTAATSGKVFIGDGTNIVLSTPTFPNASATFGKVIKSDGTNWVASTETYAAPGTSGYVMVSNGTNWTSSAKNLDWDKWAQWDGGSTGLTATTGRTSLGGTTIGQAMFTLTNPSATTFPRFNADNTVTALSAADFRTAIGAGTSSAVGTVTSVAMTTPTGLSISGSPITSSGTLALSLTAGYIIPTTTEQTNWGTAYTNRITSLTTTGSSGASTLISNVLNIPQYQAAGTYSTDIHANITALNAVSGTNTGDNATNSQYSGLVTNATHSGDATGSGALTLATVNSNVGTYNGITVNAKGLVTAAASGNYATGGGTATGTNTGDQTLTIAGTTSPTIALSGSNTATFSAGTGITLGQSAGTITVTNNITQYTDALARGAVSFTAGSGAYNSTTGVFTIPTNTNQLTNGAGFLTDYTDVYWTGTATNLVAATGRTSLGLGSAAVLNAATANTASTVVQRDGSGNVSLIGDFCTTSDIRLKKNIRSIDWSKLENLDKINWVQYAKKTESDSVIRYGIKAQELEKILPQFVHTSRDSMQTKSVDYNSMFVVLIAQHAEEIKLLKEQNKQLEQVVKDQRRRIEKLENKNKWEAKQMILQ